MRNSILQGLLAAALIGISVNGCGEEVGCPEIGSRWLSCLQEGDSVVVDFSSRGCEHFDIWQFVFRADHDLIVSMNENPDPRNSIDSARLILVGNTILSPRYVVHLDSCLDLYRTTHLGEGCTTIEWINVSWYLTNQSVRTESFVDSACGAYQRANERGVDDKGHPIVRDTRRLTLYSLGSAMKHNLDIGELLQRYK